MENKKRLIDVDEVLKKLREVEPSLKVVSVVGVKAVPIDAVIRYLERQKTVDAVEVVHGRWKDRPTGAYGRWQSWCSACGKRSGIGGIESNRHKPYCPNCGAKMDGERNGMQ